MKIINDEKFFTIGEVAKRLLRSTQTIKNWYEWADTQEELDHSLPKVYQNIDSRGTRYFRESDIETLIEFRDNISYGQLASINRPKWGERGQGIIQRKNV